MRQRHQVFFIDNRSREIPTWQGPWEGFVNRALAEFGVPQEGPPPRVCCRRYF
jgi:hypothetical protein